MLRSRIWIYFIIAVLIISFTGCAAGTTPVAEPAVTVSPALTPETTPEETIEIPEADCESCELPEIVPLPEGYSLEDDLAAMAGENGADSETVPGEYQTISIEEAKTMMDSGDAVTIVDVRTREEYETGHIPGALLIPNETISDQQPELLPDQSAVILVYCRSGNRSRQASQKLADMGYTEVYDFGGIIDWPYETVTGPNP